VVDLLHCKYTLLLCSELFRDGFVVSEYIAAVSEVTAESWPIAGVKTTAVEGERCRDRERCLDRTVILGP
jgi:hypothetical protein